MAACHRMHHSGVLLIHDLSEILTWKDSTSHLVGTELSDISSDRSCHSYNDYPRWLRFFSCQPHNARSRQMWQKSSKDQTSQGWNLFEGYTDTSRRLADDVDNDTRYHVVGGGFPSGWAGNRSCGSWKHRRKKLHWMGGIHVSLPSSKAVMMMAFLGLVFVLEYIYSSLGCPEVIQQKHDHQRYFLMLLWYVVMFADDS